MDAKIIKMNSWKISSPTLALSCFFLISSCAAQDACRPGNYDGAWIAVGASPPDISQIKEKLIGMTVGDAEFFLGSPSLESQDQPPDEATRKHWLFERMKQLRSSDCVSEEITQYRQDILWIEADIRDGRIQSCILGIKGSISRKIRESDEIFAGKKGPLDANLGACTR